MPSPAAFACGRTSALPQANRALARNKRVRQVSRRQIVRPAEPLRLSRAILLEVATLMRLRHQIRRDVLSYEYGLQVIGEQNALRPRAGNEVHDPALEALIHEVAVARVWRRLRDRRTPDDQAT